jgi:hypothetical protein
VGVGGTGVGGTGVGVSVGGIGVRVSVGSMRVGVSVGGTGVGVGGTGVGVGGTGVGDWSSPTGVGDVGCLTEIGISVVTSCIATIKTESPTKQVTTTTTMHPPPPMITHHLLSMRGLFPLESTRKPFASATRSFNRETMALTIHILSYPGAKIKNPLAPWQGRPPSKRVR